MTVALLFASRLGPVALLGLPPRPGPRRLPARLAAIALPRPSWPKALLTSFEQTQSRPRSSTLPARRTLPPAALLIFGMACSTLGRAQGRSLLPEAPAPEGIALLSGAQQIFGFNTRSTTLAQRSDACGPFSGLVSFPGRRRRGYNLPPTLQLAGHHRLLATSSVRLVSSHRHSPLAAWSPPARQNGPLPRRR